MGKRMLNQKYKTMVMLELDIIVHRSFLIRGALTPQVRPHKTCRKHVISVFLLKLTDMVKLVRKNTGKLASHILFNGAMPREK